MFSTASSRPPVQDTKALKPGDTRTNRIKVTNNGTPAGPVALRADLRPDRGLGDNLTVTVEQGTGTAATAVRQLHRLQPAAGRHAGQRADVTAFAGANSTFTNGVGGANSPWAPRRTTASPPRERGCPNRRPGRHRHGDVPVGSPGVTPDLFERKPAPPTEVGWAGSARGAERRHLTRPGRRRMSQIGSGRRRRPSRAHPRYPSASCSPGSWPAPGCGSSPAASSSRCSRSSGGALRRREWLDAPRLAGRRRDAFAEPAVEDLLGRVTVFTSPTPTAAKTKVHRVTAINGNGTLTTKGDNNSDRRPAAPRPSRERQG